MMTAEQVNEARRLRAANWSWRAIGRHFGFHRESVRRQVEPGFAEKENARNGFRDCGYRRKEHSARQRRKYEARLGDGGRCLTVPWDCSDAAFVKPHVYRTPKTIIDRKMVVPAARAFAAGEITRAEMMTWIDGDAS